MGRKQLPACLQRIDAEILGTADDPALPQHPYEGEDARLPVRMKRLAVFAAAVDARDRPEPSLAPDVMNPAHASDASPIGPGAHGPRLFWDCPVRSERE